MDKAVSMLSKQLSASRCGLGLLESALAASRNCPVKAEVSAA